MEDGFSTASQVSYTEHKQHENLQGLEAGLSTTDSIQSKFFKIDLTGEPSHSGNKEEDENVSKEKIHTNVSLLSKFRTF